MTDEMAERLIETMEQLMLALNANTAAANAVAAKATSSRPAASGGGGGGGQSSSGDKTDTARITKVEFHDAWAKWIITTDQDRYYTKLDDIGQAAKELEGGMVKITYFVPRTGKNKWAKSVEVAG